MFRFVHASDLHLGKPFGRFPEAPRNLLQQARAALPARMAEIAGTQGAGHVLLAGDTFDQTTPAPDVVRKAMNAIRGAPDITFVLMPGNHDHANAAELWAQVARDAPENLRLALEPVPLSLAPGVVLLPAPPSERRPGRDLTEWFDTAPSPEGALRVGLAHGSVTDFGTSEEGASSVIPPDRARRAGLAYLGLGDWHGQLRIGAETWYSGAPEADSFRHTAPPGVLLVELAGGASPAVTPLPTATLHWTRARLELSGAPDEDPAALHDAALPPLADRVSTLLDLRVTGRAGPLARVALTRAIAAAEPDFLWHAVDLDGLAAVHDTQDLDAIDRQGALRAAARALSEEAANPAHDPATRETARAALSYLFTYALEE
ncbi:MAG: metallophosphoesterase [Rhodobacteraceae bacterium]|nr:metallophosphoesterase [Paracoccaceae bacterium]